MKRRSLFGAIAAALAAPALAAVSPPAAQVVGRTWPDGRPIAAFVPVTDPGHTHSISDPGHSHSMLDPGHNHYAYSKR